MTRILLQGGIVFDAASGSFAPADIVVEGDRIVGVGLGLDGDDSVDCSGRWILPGFIDAHVHVMFGHLDMLRQMQTPFSYRFYAAMENLGRTLAAGITSVRDAGGADAGVRKAVADGIIAGPRMQIALTMLSQTGGHGDGWTPSGGFMRLQGSYPGMPSNIVDGVEGMRSKVREVLRSGADVIKVATSGGVLSPNDDPRHAHFAADELEMLVQEAEQQGRFVMAHAQATDGIKNAIRAGIRSIEHGIYLDDEAIGMMLERGTYLVPTLMAPRGVIDAAESGIPIAEQSLRKAAEVVEVHADSIARAASAGVKIAMGTDSGVSPHGDNLGELVLMERVGMQPTDVLRSTTIVAAELMGWGDQVGSIEEGKFADLVVVDTDPIDLAALPGGISEVWKGGVPVPVV